MSESPQLSNAPTFVSVFSKQGPAECFLQLLSKQKKTSVILLTVCKELNRSLQDKNEKEPLTSVSLELVCRADGTDCFNLVLWFLHLPTPPDPEYVLCACAALGREDFIFYLSQNFPGYSVDPVSEEEDRKPAFETLRRTSNILAVLRGAVVGGQNKLASMFKPHLPDSKYFKLNAQFWRLGIENGFLIESFASDNSIIEGDRILENIQSLRRIPLKDLETAIREVPSDPNSGARLAVTVLGTRSASNKLGTGTGSRTGVGSTTAAVAPAVQVGGLTRGVASTTGGGSTSVKMKAPQAVSRGPVGVSSTGAGGSSVILGSPMQIGPPMQIGVPTGSTGVMSTGPERPRLTISKIGSPEEIRKMRGDRTEVEEPQQRRGGGLKGSVSLFHANDDLVSALALNGQTERVLHFVKILLPPNPQQAAEAIDRFMAAAILGGHSDLAKGILEQARKRMLLTVGEDTVFMEELTGNVKREASPLSQFFETQNEFAKCAATMTGQTDVLKWMRTLDVPFQWSYHMHEKAARHAETLRWMMSEADPPCPPLSIRTTLLRNVTRSVISRGDIPMMALLDELYPGALQATGACQEAAAAKQWHALSWLLTKNPPCTWNHKGDWGENFSDAPEIPDSLKLFEVEFRKHILAHKRTAPLPPPPPELEPALQKHVRESFVSLYSIFSGMRALEYGTCDWRLFSWLVNVGGGREVVEILRKEKMMEGDPRNPAKREIRPGCLSGFLLSLSWHIGMMSLKALISHKGEMKLKTFRKFQREFHRLLNGLVSLHSWCKHQGLPFWPEDNYRFRECMEDIENLTQMKEFSPLLPLLEEAKALRGPEEPKRGGWLDPSPLPMRW
uniref:Uncharacterized protein n=1 Tax=Chromera velia CCMP2878 TaxID=1169474 RepID=A0A0G4GBI6_9ALVE|eukprot:Cvel_21151.t1-p1 / transcript=Cvel_21151.t1 / gene=Cvel_21151 / organism=Chromera_velia_CCMP2878 / gene_product=hypothetical protein / transcript_product=hypothetical protein / location=Cvel_scaffold1961:8055-10586(+) / protein_length=844 / sequence_SO=supercontig / SO=protein_coding / is_pseudo=false